MRKIARSIYYRYKIFLFIVLSLFFITLSSTSVYAKATIPGASSQGLANSSLVKQNSNCKKTSFFGLEPWYQYLQLYQNKVAVDGTSVCQVCFNVFGNQTQNTNCSKSPTSDITLVLIAIVDDLLRIAGMVAIIMVLYSSVSYIISQGQPESIAKARSSIINALIGAAIAMVAIVLVSFIGSKLGGG